MNRTLKYCLLAARIAGTCAAFAAAAAVLYIFEYVQQWNQIDNLTGALPAAFAFLFAGGCTALIWMKHSRRTAPVAIALAVTIALCTALYPTALRGNWWLDYKHTTEGAGPDLTLYAPFKEDSLAVKLEQKPSIYIESDLPALDGATALYPVYAAFAQAVYDQTAFEESDVKCSNTAGAYRAIISGEADIIFVAAPSKKQFEAARDAGVSLEFTSIGKEAFVFITGKTNPVENLTTTQIRNIYTGKTAMWSTLGWKEGGRIIAFRRPEGSGSESGLANLVMDGRPIFAPQPLPAKSLAGTNSLMQQVSVWYNGVQPALGYSYRYFAGTMYANSETKFLSVDGYAPTIENIQSGKYPFIAEVYAVTRGKPQGNAKKLIDWILSAQGQYIIEKTGYSPLY